MPRKTIMTVDDSPSVRQFVKMTLQNAGFDVVEAEDGKDALAKMNGLPIHLAFVDLNMPNMNGIEFIKAVRSSEKYRFIPLIMLTTESQMTKKQEGKKAGATGWIVKPFKQEQLLAVVKKVLG
ncbi:two-component system response regulator [candidate division KSB1 bacterium 4484_87]|nr:MAG: two-component system response regulator [candidate division KSB1 bacterium 4484_87]